MRIAGTTGNLGPYETDTVVCGECSRLMESLPDNCIDLTVTSPPYDNLRDYEGFAFKFGPIAAQLWRVTKPGGVVVWVVGDATVDGGETGTSFRQALEFMELGFRLHDTMIYQTNKMPLTHNRYEPGFEYMFILSKGPPKTFNPIREKTVWGGATKWYGHSPTNVRASAKQGSAQRHRQEAVRVKHSKIKSNVWFFPSGFGKTTADKIAYQHPAIFPEALARDHILSWSNPGDLVFDPMCGSGTTLKMAIELGRHYLGFDISGKYAELARRRVQGARIPLLGIE